jgi:hypothetical protein
MKNSKSNWKNYYEKKAKDLFMIHGGKFIFIRFNPHIFTNELGTKKKPYMKRRMEYLEKEINNKVDKINKEENSELLEMVYLFYDGFDYNFN